MAPPVIRLISRSIVLALPLLIVPAPSRAGVATAGGVVALRNSTWDVVQVEIRIGPGSACDSYPSTPARALKRGEVWGVVASGTVCWRREASPGAQPATWTPWQTRAIPTAGVTDVAL